MSSNCILIYACAFSYDELTSHSLLLYIQSPKILRVTTEEVQKHHVLLSNHFYPHRLYLVNFDGGFQG